MKSIRTRNRAIILLTAGTLSLISALAFAADYNFVGTWKGEYNPAASAPPPTPAAAPGGGRGGAGNFGGGGPQKITLRVKVNKDKASGNFTMGSSQTEDIRESRIEGNKLMFKTGLAPAPIYEYEAVLTGETLSVTRNVAGGRGGKPTLFELTRSK